jgi:hypothetical protein
MEAEVNTEEVSSLSVEPEEKVLPPDLLAAAYIKIRDAIDTLTADYEDAKAKLEEQKNVVAEKLLEVCNDNNATSIKTKHGTIMRKVSTRYWTNDWESMYAFIKDNDAYALLERRIHQGNLKQFLEENPDTVPMGLQADSKYTISVRRSKA